MSTSRITIFTAVLLVAGIAHAGSYTITPTIATDYDFRGYSQTDPVNQDGKPAFQLGGTYNFDGGAYVGAWGSNIDDSIEAYGIDGDNIEVDLYGGYAWGDAAKDFAYDVGINLYTYPGLSDANMVEAYVGVSRDIYSAKLWYSPDVASSNNSGFYAELNANYPMGSSGLSLLAHVGDAIGAAYNEPVDFSIGVGYTVGRMQFTMKYVDGTRSIRGRVIGAVSTTLPWS
jgi:uncharacterized protein (TIGR02001 family)